MSQPRTALKDANRNSTSAPPPAKAFRPTLSTSITAARKRTAEKDQGVDLHELVAKKDAYIAKQDEYIAKREEQIAQLKERMKLQEETHQKDFEAYRLDHLEKRRIYESSINQIQLQYEAEKKIAEQRNADNERELQRLTLELSVSKVRYEGEVDNWRQRHEQSHASKTERIAELDAKAKAQDAVIATLQVDLRTAVVASIQAESEVAALRRSGEAAAGLQADITALRQQREGDLARIRDLEEQLAATRSDARAAAQTADHEAAMRVGAAADTDRARAEIAELKAQIAAAATEQARRDEELRDVKARYGEMTADVARKAAAIEQLTRDCAAERERVQVESSERQAVRQQLETAEAAAAALTAELASLRTSSMKDFASRAGELERLRATVGAYEIQLAEHAAERRRLHNEVMELKGNIRVYCRVRPRGAIGLGGCDAGGAPLAAQSDTLDFYAFPDKMSDQRTVVVSGLTRPDITGRAANVNVPPFVFDRVYAPTAPQDVVFEDISRLVQSALDGYKVCIFAYGQTGSGKTFTMEGGASTTTAGMIPRSVDQVFVYADSLRKAGWRFEITARFVEIYNDTIRDLVGDIGGGAGGEPHEIQIARDGTHTVSGVQVVPVDSSRKVLELLARARKNRATAATNMNERSSRSHSVFTLSMKGSHADTRTVTQGVLNLVDLAGSERVDQSGATGDRFQEAVCINKSLSLLARVIQQIGEKSKAGRAQQHVSYRDCKLTHLLQPCLGRDSKVLMFVNIAPEGDHLTESINSMRFAAQVNAVSVGQASRSIKEV